MKRLVVLGGSTPFAAALVNALESAASSIGQHELVLHGRSVSRLELLANYARARLGPLGWEVVPEASLPASLAGADIVLHQIRYGGMRGRREDEALCLGFGIEPDETLGPGALQALLRMLPGLRMVGRAIVDNCPRAWVLNLTNPLSVATSLLVEMGVERCVGLCELPLVTARRAAAVLRLPLDAIEWDYVGLNHRGFIVRFSHRGRDRLSEVAQRLGSGELEGVSAAVISELRAIPTKYFSLVQDRKPGRGGRAAFLAALRREILDELREHPDRSPPSLGKRYLEWYPQSVVPMIEALESSSAVRRVVNVVGRDGVAWELPAQVGRWAVEPLARPSPGPAVSAWLRRFEAHERALVALARDPDRDRLDRAIDLDPMIADRLTEALNDAIWSRHRRRPAS